MQSMSRYITTLAAVAAIATASAQDLSTEITVDRIVEPTQTAAQRPALMPRLLAPKMQAGYPKAAEWLEPGAVTPLLTRLGAARWEDSIAHTAHRGYMAGGYFPTLNYGVDAGYRFIDTPEAWLGASLQWHGLAYKRAGFDLSRQHAMLEAHGGYRPNAHSALTGSVRYRFGRVQEPYMVSAASDQTVYYTQNSNEIEAAADWLSQPGRLAYDLGVTLDHFAFAEASPAPLAADVDPLAQTMLKFRLGAGLTADDAERGLSTAVPRRYGIDAEGMMLHTNNAAGTLGLWRLRPYARFGRDAFSGRVGLGLSLASGSGTSLQFSPELDLAYAPIDKPFAASLTLTGGKEANALRDLFDINPYISPVVSYGFSRVLMDLEASIAIGPVAGFRLEAFGAFALPREWVMPALTDRSAYGGDLMAGVSAESARLGARLRYAWRSIFAVGASAELGHSEDGLMTWYRWHDSARYVYSAWAEAHPIDGLDISLRWDLRRGRSILLTDGWEADDASSRRSLGNARTITLGASYSITRQLTAFVNAGIHNKHLLISALPAPTLTGIAGVAYKF